MDGANAAELFARKNPVIRFDGSGRYLSGNTRCNNFNTAVMAEGTRHQIGGTIATTRIMACKGAGEQLFLQALAGSNAFSVGGDKCRS